MKKVNFEAILFKLAYKNDAIRSEVYDAGLGDWFIKKSEAEWRKEKQLEMELELKKQQALSKLTEEDKKVLGIV